MGTAAASSGSAGEFIRPTSPRSFTAGVSFASRAAPASFGAKYPDRVRTVDPGRLTFTSTLRYLPSGLPFDVW